MTKIMLVEDDKSLREIYGVRLLAEGYDIVSAGDGEEALAMAIKDRPDLIVSDVMMPKISGFDMLDILRSTTETKDIKVIMMTALSSDEQRQRGEQLGADMYLVKSQVGIEDVVKAVHQVLADKPGSSPAPAEPSAVPPVATPNPAAAIAGAVPPAPVPPAPSPDQPVSEVASTTIPQPTAPFTGARPTGLGDRVIQPLKDNPRVSNVDVGELMDKEFASTVQDVENVADGASSAIPPTDDSTDATSMSAPVPTAPVSDDAVVPAPTTPPPTVPLPADEPAITPPPTAPEPPVEPPVPPVTEQPTEPARTDTPTAPPAL